MRVPTKIYIPVHAESVAKVAISKKSLSWSIPYLFWRATEIESQLHSQTSRLPGIVPVRLLACWVGVWVGERWTSQPTNGARAHEKYCSPDSCFWWRWSIKGRKRVALTLSGCLLLFYFMQYKERGTQAAGRLAAWHWNTHIRMYLIKFLAHSSAQQVNSSTAWPDNSLTVRAAPITAQRMEPLSRCYFAKADFALAPLCTSGGGNNTRSSLLRASERAATPIRAKLDESALFAGGEQIRLFKSIKRRINSSSSCGPFKHKSLRFIAEEFHVLRNQLE